METLVRSQAGSDNHHTEISDTSKPEAQTTPEKVVACSLPFAAGLKPHLFYKCLLNQHAQKFRKDLPIFQTHNEGFAHLPKFRSTVWFDGMSYTSSNTFQQRKAAEMDVSKTAYFAIMQKSKNDALHLILKDKTFCKSILVEYAAKMNLGKPTYETAQLDTSVPVFRSSLVFNGVTFQGDSAKNKKEAEQLAAHAAILKYLDSESGNDLSEIINCKFRHYVDMNKVREINNVHNDTSVVGTQMIVDNAIGLNEAKTELGTTKMPESSAFLLPVVTQSPIPKVSSEAITPTVPGPALLTQTPSAEINNSSLSSVVSAAPCLGKFASTPAPGLSSNVFQPINSEVSLGTVVPPLPLASQALEHLPFVGHTLGRKRNRKNKKNAQKKMRVDAQMPIPAVTSAVPPCSSQ
ncbi:Double-stranded RNA-binding [Cynara cardunculus var. scolymus]|uniref:Double-stranded RNA-binding n=1 Tax=Cynara cardunculus var. scolymus TaxID=59895 RepID=A0A103XKE3_CYNCS|nr:Double-stranded RNA-binding [Cynara cardunculus var. scolymus]